MATNAPQDDFQKTALRLPKELHARVHEAAAEEGRSYNSQLIHIVQEYFAGIEKQVAQLEAGLDQRQEEFVSFGLGDASDREAILKVLLFDEISVLRRRVARLGGKSKVLKATKRDLVQTVVDEKIEGTHADRASHFTQTVGTWPLTALLTDEELGRIAQRIVTMQDSMKRAAPEAPGSAPEPIPQTREEMRRGVEEAKAAYLAAQKELDELPPLQEEEPPAQPKPRLAAKRPKKA